MAQAVIFQFGDVELLHQAVVVIAVCAWLCRTLIIGKHIKIVIDNLFQRLYHGKQLLAHGYFAAGVFGFGCVDDKFRMLFLSLNDIDTFNRATDSYRTVRNIDVAPLQSAYFTDAQPSAKADINAKPGKCEVTLDVVKNLSVIGDRQYFQFFVSGGCRVLYIPFLIAHPFILNPELHHHFKDYQNVLDGFDTQSVFQLL